VKQVITDQTITNQKMESLSNAVSNLTTKKENLGSKAKQVITDQTITNQKVESLSNAVSNLTTKKQTAIMHSRIEHMFAQLMHNKYSFSQVEFPPELQITFTVTSTDNDMGMIDGNSDDGAASNISQPLSSCHNNINTMLGLGNHINSRLSSDTTQMTRAQK
jgi:hypothetical protein